MDEETLYVRTAIDSMDSVIAFIEEHTAHIDNTKVVGQLLIVVEELTLNIIQYAYDGNQGDLHISVSDDSEKRQFSIEFRDSGKPFNPLQQNEPDLSVPLSERKIGGLGLTMVKKITDDQSYVYENNQNIFSIVKAY